MVSRGKVLYIPIKVENYIGCDQSFHLTPFLFPVSHKFGYGLMDAAAMVSLAEQWTPVPPQHICKSQEIPEDRYVKCLKD